MPEATKGRFCFSSGTQWHPTTLFYTFQLLTPVPYYSEIHLLNMKMTTMSSRYISMRVQQAALAALLTLLSGTMPTVNAQSQPLPLFSGSDRHAPITLEDSLYAPEPFYSLSLFDPYVLLNNTCTQPSIQSIDALMWRVTELMYTHPEEALRTAEEALALAQRTGNTLAEAWSLSVIGNIRIRQGNLPEALRAHLQALELYEFLENEEGIAASLDNVGHVYQWQGNTEQTMHYSIRALEIYENMNDQEGIARLHNNMGRTLIGVGLYEESIHHLEKALFFAKEISSDSNQTSAVTANLGLALAYLGNHEEALKYLHQSNDLSKQIGHEHLQSIVANRLSRSYLAIGHIELALSFSEQSLALAQKINNPYYIIYSYETIANIYATQDDYQNAYEYQILYAELRDNIYSDQIINDISDLRLQYEMTNVEQQVENLRQQNHIHRLQSQQRQNVLLGGLGVLVLMTGFSINRYRLKKKANHLLTSKNEQIKGILEEKELLIKEIHHRVKNNLQVLSSMLRLQTQSLESPAALEAMQDMQTRVSSMTLLHQELYGEYASTHVPMQGYVEKLSQHLLRAFNTEEGYVHCFVHAHDVQLNADTAMPLGLILNELISNALKHAFPDARNGIIQIHLNRSKEDGWYELAVSDNGVGCSADNVLEESGQDGLTLLQVMTHQLHGTLRRIDDGEGVAYSIRFKEKEERT